MTDYSNIPEVSQLYSESQAISSAIDMLENDGSITSITVMPKPANNMMQMGVSVTLPPPTSPSAAAQVVNILRERQRAIDARLTELGVSGSPAVPPTASE